MKDNHSWIYFFLDIFSENTLAEFLYKWSNTISMLFCNLIIPMTIGHFPTININISLSYSTIFAISWRFIVPGDPSGLPRTHILLGPIHLGSHECPQWCCGRPWYTGSEIILHCCISTFYSKMLLLRIFIITRSSLHADPWEK